MPSKRRFSYIQLFPHKQTSETKMNPKPNQPQQKEVKNPQKTTETYSWNPERILDTLMKNHEKVEKNWVEKGIPKLIDDTIKNYETFGGMDHLEEKDLPSKKIVTEILE